MAKQAGTLEVHEHSYTGGGKRGSFAHSHEGGSTPHLHPDTGPSHFTGRWPRDRRKFTAKPTGPHLPYVERPPEESTFRVVFVDHYTSEHLRSAGTTREDFARQRDDFIRHMETGQVGGVVVERMADSFGLTPVYELSKPEEDAMSQPSLEDLHKQHGTQPAAYIEDFVREKGGHLVTCCQCHRQCVVGEKPTKREAATWRCGNCSPRPKTAMETTG